jgi:hypothetical protein
MRLKNIPYCFGQHLIFGKKTAPLQKRMPPPPPALAVASGF